MILDYQVVSLGHKWGAEVRCNTAAGCNTQLVRVGEVSVGGVEVRWSTSGCRSMHLGHKHASLLGVVQK